MERSIELEKENSRLRDRMLKLQAKLQSLEKENVDLKEKVKRLESQLGTNPDDKSSECIRFVLHFDLANTLSPSTFEYSQQNLANVLHAIGIPPELIEPVLINVELEYQKSVSTFPLTQRPLRDFPTYPRLCLRLRPLHERLHRTTAGIPLSLLPRNALRGRLGSPFLRKFPRSRRAAGFARLLSALRPFQVLLHGALDRLPLRRRNPRGNRAPRPHRRLLRSLGAGPPRRDPSSKCC